MSLTVEVVPVLDSRYTDVSPFLKAKVYTGPIEDEVMPGETPPCFLGAWYRKVVSSKDAWLGIEGVIELGEFTPDPKRFNLDGRGRYMDVPSVYMGGKAQFESDAGLGLNLTYLSNDTTEELTYSSPKLAYRPFWRYIYKDAQDIKGNVTRREINSWNVANPRALMYYYFPGDKIRMKVFSPMPNYLQLYIEVVETTKIPKYVELRKKYNLPGDKPADFFSPIFHSGGQGIEPAEFKRVNAIDQYGNEGFHAKMTDAKVSKATWSAVYLFRRINGEIVKVPFSLERQISMICPNKEAITVNVLDPTIGSETIELHPEKTKKGD